MMMLGLFEKRTPLIDFTKGFVDIHNHLLPGIDDGAANVEESISLVKRFREIGINKFISTPHIMNDYYPNTPSTINAALKELRNSLKEEGIHDIEIHAAAEYMMDHSFMNHIESGDLLTLNSNQVLVEMSYFQAPINLNEILFQLQANGFKPVLAHPERYAFYHSKKLEKFEELKKRGCYFQLNILSLIGHYGKHIQEAAYGLLDSEMIDYLGTDTHQMRHLEKLSTAKLPQKRMRQLEPIIKNTSETFITIFS